MTCKDKDVGELWNVANAPYRDQPFWKEQVKKLIRKLVEERAEKLQAINEAYTKDFTDDALKDFGIDPENYHD